MIRITEFWRQRQQRRARVNEALARADQRERQEWVDRTRVREERLWELLEEPGSWDRDAS